MLTIHVEVSRRESPALVSDATSDLLILILGSPGNLFLSLGFETQVTVKKKTGFWCCRSHLPSDNHSSLLAVNHYSSLRTAHMTEQQARLLLGTASSCQARIPRKSGRVRCQSLPRLPNADLQRIRHSPVSARLHGAAEAEQRGRTIMHPVSHYIR